MPAFLHHLAARQLSITHVASCDPLEEEEHQASKDQLPDQQDQTRPGRTSSRSQTTRPDSMQCSRCPALLALVVLVLCGPGVSSQRDRDQGVNQDLDLELSHHRLLQRARNAGLLSQEWSKRTVEDLLAQLALPEADAQREDDVVSMATGGRMDLERSADDPNNLPPRERKAGCKNFYWKGFTSC
ncbi:somatostatin 1.2 [Antennarius striatus]|uniref:somatostatin 1.2 n=1 Tax=Antennarius striatus TaxID=241820 RepID=UPI0035B0A000